MRRFLLVLLGGLLLNTAVFAQQNSSVQVGRATHDLQVGGLRAAHFNIPLGSKVKIANAETEKEIEVTIIGRIPLSSIRIIDLSPAAWNALALTADTEVRLVSQPAVQNGPAPQAAGWDDEEELADAGGYIDEYTGEEELADAGGYIDEYTGEEELAGAGGNAGKNAAKNTAKADYSALVLTHTSIKVIPGLPNPNGRKIYRLQVGAYARKETADFAECTLKSAGFETRREAYGSLTRVLAVGIAAADVKLAVQAIESAGFGEVWIRE